MYFRAHYACLLGVSLALLVGVSTYQSTHANHQSVAELREQGSIYDRELLREKELKSYDGVLVERSAKRKRIVERVRDGEITLFEAALEFKQLNSLPNPAKLKVTAMFPGDSENERLCWQVICWLDGDATRDLPPSQRKAILDREKAELRANKAQNGTVVLPGE